MAPVCRESWLIVSRGRIVTGNSDLFAQSKNPKPEGDDDALFAGQVQARWGCRFAVCQPWHAADRLVKLSASAMLNSVVMHRDNRNPAGCDLILRTSTNLEMSWTRDKDLASFHGALG